jgi:cobalt-zinc-cadmium efflux system outer membrane protein
MAVLPRLTGASIPLDQALELADQNHPQLQAGAAQIEAAQAGVTTASAYPNPEFGARAGGQDYRVPGNVRGLVTSYTFSQPLELGPLRPARVQLASRFRESSELALAGTRLAVLSNVRRTFHNALRQRSEIELLNENLRLVEEFRKRLQVRVDVGEAGRLELYRADAEIATARTAANSARLQYVAALTQLRAAIGANLDADLTLDGLLDPPIVLPPLEELRRAVLERHPFMLLARADIRRAEARSSYEVALKATAAFGSSRDRPAARLAHYRAGVVMPLPFWNRREGPIAEAAAQLKQARAVAANQELQLLAAVGGAYSGTKWLLPNWPPSNKVCFREAEAGLRAAETASSRRARHSRGAGRAAHPSHRSPRSSQCPVRPAEARSSTWTNCVP